MPRGVQRLPRGAQRSVGNVGPRRRALLHKPTLRDRARLFVPLRSWRLQLLGAALAVAAAIISAQSFATAREATSVNLIQQGDTLLGSAATTGVALDHLVSLNGITNPDFIVAGQTLSLDGSAQATVHGPVQPASDPSTGPQYTVKAGDTVWDIAQTNGVSVDSVPAVV
jgi:LysM repeat protein